MRFLKPRQSSALRIAGSGCRPGHATEGTSQADYSGLNLCFQRCSPKVSGAIGEIGVPSVPVCRARLLLENPAGCAATVTATAISPMISRFPCLCRWSGFAVRFGSVTGEVSLGAIG